MKYFILPILFLALFFSCTNNAKEKDKLKEMNKSFKIYMRDNDLKKNFVTKLERVQALSYTEILEGEREHENELYEAKIYIKGTTSLMNSSRIYNLRDTMTCYFDANLKMLRHINPNNE